MKKIIILIIGIISFSTAKAQLQGVLFSEYRMILKDNSIASLQMSNPTKETRSYNLSFINKRVDENGVITDIPDSVDSPYSLKKYLRVFPRTVKLAPGESQEIQIQLKAPSSIANGEYRSYLHFLPLDNNGSPGEIKSNGGVQFAIQFRIGAAIPIFYRKNTNLDNVVIDNVKLAKDKKNDTVLNLTINRNGTRSTYGTITVEGYSKGTPIKLSELTGTAVYADIKKKHVSLPIAVSKLDRDASGKTNLIITYTDDEDKTKSKPTVFTKRTISVEVPK